MSAKFDFASDTKNHRRLSAPLGINQLSRQARFRERVHPGAWWQGGVPAGPFRPTAHRDGSPHRKPGPPWIRAAAVRRTPLEAPAPEEPVAHSPACLQRSASRALQYVVLRYESTLFMVVYKPSHAGPLTAHDSPSRADFRSAPGNVLPSHHGAFAPGGLTQKSAFPSRGAAGRTRVAERAPRD